MRGILRRSLSRMAKLADRPFASALGILLMASTITSITKLSLSADVLQELVPGWFLLWLSITYGIGGLLLLVGMVFDRGDVEASGCVLIISGLLIRTIALLVVLGLSPASVTTTAFYVVFAGACLERFRQILNGDKIIRIHTEVKLKFSSQEEA